MRSLLLAVMVTTWMVVCLTAANLAGASPLTAPRFSVPMDDLEVIGPFASWANLKRDYGAVGNGLADDTVALQTALGELGKPGKASVLYLPAGTYRITASLRMTGDQEGAVNASWGGLGLVGEHPAQTTILWDGPAGLPMLVQDGGFNYRYARITWDGNRKAGIGIAHWWNAKAGRLHDAGSEDTDEVFKDMGIGIMAGRMGANYGQMNSEGQIRRVTFLRNWYAGVNVGSFNALDWWIWDSHFVDCARGVSNTFSLSDAGPTSGGGAFHVYRSAFERSTLADVNIANTHWFSLHQNQSIGSRRFFQAEGMGDNAAPVIMMGNTVLDTTDPVAVDDGNLGPLMLIDNVFGSVEGASGPVIRMSDWVRERDVLSIGNTYTVSNPIQADAPADRVVADDRRASRSSLASRGWGPAMTPSWARRQVFEVTPSATTEQIQAVIDAAVASGAQNPIVHLPPGQYTIRKSLIVPPQVHLQIAGDALTTVLVWGGRGAAPIFELQGPSYVTLRDMQLLSRAGPAIQITVADQPGGRVFIEGSTIGVLTVQSLQQTQLALQANPGIDGLALNGVRSLVSMGTGALGPVRCTDSHVLLADSWYEGRQTNLFQITGCTLSYMGGLMAPASSSMTEAAVSLDKASDQITFVGAEFDLSGLASRVGVRMGEMVPNASVLLLGASARTPDYVRRGPETGQFGLVMSRMLGPHGRVAQYVDQGLTSLDFVSRALVQPRSLQWETSPYAAPVGSTDVRIYRIKANQTKGISISGL